MTNLQSDVKPAPAPSAGIGPVHVLIYRSHSLVHSAEIDHELSRILRTARARNASLGITGALMLYDSWFAQVLEGPESAVKALFARIEADKRHNGVEVLERDAHFASCSRKTSLSILPPLASAVTSRVRCCDGAQPR